MDLHNAHSSQEIHCKQDELPKPGTKEDLFILLLGETGAGKSTWINAFANYLKYSTLEDAVKANGFKVHIPFSFVKTDDDFNEKRFSFGNPSSNEDLQDGQSATQSPKEYVFETDSLSIHLIDTPGIGDVRGIPKDNENFDNILTFLLKFRKINAVCVLMKPDNARLDVAFRFCVLELLTHLHKSLKENLLFCFSHSRPTFYRPGDTMPVLERLLKKHNIVISLDDSRCFCLENEAFLCLAEMKEGIEFAENEKEVFSVSWDKSRETTEKLINRVRGLPEHDIKETLSLNEARNIVLAMSKPMAQILQVIEMNKNAIQYEKNEIDKVQKDIYGFNENFKIKGFDLEYEELDHPVTVCADPECTKQVQVGNTGKTNAVYDVICHDNCTISGLPTESTNDPRLATCHAFSFNTEKALLKFVGKKHRTEFPGYKVMNISSCKDCGDAEVGHCHWTYDKTALLKTLTTDRRKQYEEYKRLKFTENCWKCGHSFKKHMHITYKTAVVEREFLMDNAAQKLSRRESFKSDKDARIKELKEQIQEFEEERQIIMSCASDCASFLKCNALIQYNDAFKDYIDIVIHDEKTKSEHNRSKKMIDNLEEAKLTYNEKVKLLDTLKDSPQDHIQIADIFKMRDTLVNMKHFGRTLEKILNGILSTRKKREEPITIG